MNISVCIITRNEAAYLDKCLKALIKYPFEIVVTDTGSTDESIDVAGKYTDKIYTYKWNDDFSAARNFCASKASNDMIMMVDTDESARDFDFEKLMDIIAHNSGMVGRVRLNNIYTREGAQCSSYEKISRIYDRRYFHYEGKVHEQIVPFHGEEMFTYEVPVTFTHVGYDGDPEKLRPKAERNIRLLKKELARENDNDKIPYIMYQIGKSYYMLREYDNALDFFEEATGYDLNPKLEYVADLVVSYGYTLINTGQNEKALMFENLYEEFSYSCDFVFLMALIYMNNAAFDAAVGEFMKATRYKECSMEGVNSYLAFYNIGVIYECLGYNKEAIGYYLKCGGYDKAVTRLNILKGQ